jgi:hypothetical protein
MNPIKIVSISFLALAMTACGGGSPIKGSSSVTDPTTSTIDTTKEVTSVSGRNVTFLPLSILETSSEYSGFSEDNIYVTERFYPYIHGVLLATFNAKTLEPQTATIDDFVITEDKQLLDSSESFPILQKVGAIPTYLHTAIVIDVSGSVKDTVELSDIVSETKALIALLQSSDDPVIAKQRFTIWAFAGKVKELTSGFTEVKTVLDSALDQVVNPNLVDELSSSSSLNEAIVEAVGRFDGNGSDGASDELFLFRDSGGVNNDLIEGVSTNRIQLSSLIVVTSGSDSLGVFSNEQVKVAIESQSQVVFLSNTAESEEDSVTKNFGKPFIAVLVGAKTNVDVAASITENASNIIDLRNASSLSFAAKTTGLQTNLIALRKRQNDRYFLRYASPFRQGSHERVIATGAVDVSYSLTAAIEIGDFQDVGMPSEVYYSGIVTSVEITTERDEYLQNLINLNNTNVFYPATRWTKTVFASTDYSWTLDGNALTPIAATGAVTIQVADLGSSGISTLSLTNNALNETRNIQVTSILTSLLLAFDGVTGFPLNDQTFARANLGYLDLNASEPEDLDNPVVPEYVFQVDYQDYNAPQESYVYSVGIPGMIEKDPNDDSAQYDYYRIYNGFQIKKSSIDALEGPVTITVTNTALSTEAIFTITP